MLHSRLEEDLKRREIQVRGENIGNKIGRWGAQVKFEAYLWKHRGLLGIIDVRQMKNDVGLIAPEWEQWQW